MAVLGIIDLYFNGTKIDIKPGGTVTFGGIVSKAVIIGRQVDFTNVMTQSDIEVETAVRTGMAVLDLLNQPAGELQVHCDSGQIFIWSMAKRVDTSKATAGENSSLALHYVGGTPVEVSQ